MLELVLRLGISLAVVLGLFWLVARTGARRLGGGRGLMRVHGRQSLSRTASVAVVEVGSRVLVVGVSDGGVRLLTELDPEEIARDEPATEQAAPTVIGGVTGRVSGAGPTARLAGLVAARLTQLRAARRTARSVPAGEIAGSEGAGLETAGIEGAGIEIAGLAEALEAPEAAVPTDATGASVAPAVLATPAAPIVPATPAVPATPVVVTERTTTAPAPAGRAARTAPAARAARVPDAGTGALSGSLLAPQTWRQAWAAATSRTPVPASLDAAVPAGATSDETRIGDPVHG